MKESEFELLIPEEHHLERIDKVLAMLLEIDISRSYLQKLIKNSDIKVNDADIKPNYKVKTNDKVTIVIPAPSELEINPENIKLDIIYEDKDIAVINKQAGLVVHPGPGNWSGTLVNGLLYSLKNLSGIGGVLRPGIVHRLDKDTAGLMVVAKNDEAHNSLVKQFSERTVIKKYCAIVTGVPDSANNIIDLPIGRHKIYRHKMTVTEKGKPAITEYHNAETWNFNDAVYSMLDIRIYTGRTHQIRVHLSSKGHPIVGDMIYSKSAKKHKVPYLLLASVYLSLEHPTTGARMEFNSDLPEHIKSFINRIK